VDLALVALLAERAYLDGIPQVATVAPAPDFLVPRIGEYLLKQGQLTEEQLEHALNRQKRLNLRGKRRLLGQTLVELGFVNRETIDRAINNQIIELHGALQDANRTLERRVEERTAELRNALEHLKELNQIKASLISNVSHELRTPLAHIKGYVELMAEAQLGPLSEDQLRALEVVQGATSRLERLIEDLLEFSTASREGLRINPQAIDLSQLARETLVRSSEKASKADVALEADVADDLPPAMADRERLGWVLHQLVDNGIKFTPAGGKVLISSRAEKHRILIAVRDTGMGIPQDRMDEIFEPFHQLDGSPTRRFGGTGLGLSLVRLILNSHRTDIRIQSEEGKGTTLVFSLPVAKLGS
jgi:signal transduction histidine kinase